MAASFAPSNAFDYAKIYVKNTKLDDVEVRLLDDVNKYMWMAAPWRWTLGSLPFFNLIAGTSDYTVGPSLNDVLFLQSAYVSDGATAPRQLTVDPTLPSVSKYVGQPNRISIISNTGGNIGLRVVPVASSFNGTNTVISIYKKIAPNIASGNRDTAGALIFDDEWFWVYQEGVLWRTYLYSDDERAGSATVADGKVQYTGQRASFEAGLQMMRQTEKLYLPERSKEP